MQIQDLIDEIVVSELKGLCYTCQHVDTCAYRKHTSKKIIQCELYTLAIDTIGHIPDNTTAIGLCKTCDHASRCGLPGRKAGVWHCNEFE